jgi:hypothetical protein
MDKLCSMDWLLPIHFEDLAINCIDNFHVSQMCLACNDHFYRKKAKQKILGDTTQEPGL